MLSPVNEGDQVVFYMRKRAHEKMQRRTATVVKVYAEELPDVPKYTFVDLDVDFTDEDDELHFAGGQTHVRRGEVGKVQSGQWMPR